MGQRPVSAAAVGRRQIMLNDHTNLQQAVQSTVQLNFESEVAHEHLTAHDRV